MLAIDATLLMTLMMMTLMMAVLSDAVKRLKRPNPTDATKAKEATANAQRVAVV